MDNIDFSRAWGAGRRRRAQALRITNARNTDQNQPDQPEYTDCANCGTVNHTEYRCPCECHATRGAADV